MSLVILLFIIIPNYIFCQNEWCFKNPTSKNPCKYILNGENLFELRHGEKPNHFGEVNNELECTYKGNDETIPDSVHFEWINSTWVKKGIFIKDCSWNLFKFIFSDTDIMKNLKDKITYLQINGQLDSHFLPMETYEFPNLISTVFPYLEFLHILNLNIITNTTSQNWPPNLWKIEVDYMGNEMLPQLINSSITDLKLKDCDHLENVSSINSLTKLKSFTLYHSNDKLPSLPKKLFNNNLGLRRLYISASPSRYNKLIIHPSLFEDLKNIEHIRIEAVFLNLSDTREEIFKQCSKLQEFIWIHGSCEFPKDFLTKNDKLKTFVYVESERTCKKSTNIHETDILNAPMIEHLTIKNTKLNYNNLILDLSSKFKNLKILNLQKNNIAHFEDQGYFKKLKILDLSGNPIKCDCDIINQLTKLNSSNFNISYLTQQELVEQELDIDYAFHEPIHSKR